MSIISNQSSPKTFRSFYSLTSCVALLFQGMVEGVWVVTDIDGPWDEPYVRNVEHDPEDHFNIDWDSINVDDLIQDRRK